MRFGLSALLSLWLGTSVTPQPTSVDNITLLNFDTLPTHLGLGPLPIPHHHLLFSSFSVITPTHPALKKFISPHDLNCAVSAPNALVGSRLPKDLSAASFEIANGTDMSELGLEPFFTLHGFNVKPMDAPEPGTWVVVRGVRVDEREEEGGLLGEGREGEEVLEWSVFFPSGFHEVFEVRIEEFSRRVWSRLSKIEIQADFGYDGLDWEFCVDNLRVEFLKKGKEVHQGGRGRLGDKQRILDAKEM